MLKIDSPIVYTDIYNVVALAQGHPVYKLEGWGDDKGQVDAIVVKMESMKAAANMGNVRDVGMATALMTIIDKNARTLVLKKDEVAQLKLYAEAGNVADQTGLRTAGDLLKDLNDPMGVWTKMEVKRLTQLDKALAKRLQGDKADVRVIAAALKAHGGLEKLGKIIAVDLFNGNNDRFIYPGPGKKEDGMTVRFKAIWNLGNVLVAAGSPIGLDSYDPNNTTRDLNVAVTANSDWSGMLLTQGMKAEREQFVADIIEDLELALGPRNRKSIMKVIGSKNRLGSNRKDRLMKGMLAGKNMLQQALVPRRNHPNFPIGLSSRMALLGW